MRLKHRKQTGNTTREYLSISDGQTPNIVFGVLRSPECGQRGRCARSDEHFVIAAKPRGRHPVPASAAWPSARAFATVSSSQIFGIGFPIE